MTTLKANGGVVRRWVKRSTNAEWRERRTLFRLVLCGNGRFLVSGGMGRWRHWRERLTVEEAEGDLEWREVSIKSRWPSRD